MDLLGLSALFAGLATEIELEIHESLKTVGKIVEDEAKDEIGTQQGAAGPTAAWADLADSTKETRVALGYPEDEPLLRDGDLRDSITHEIEGNTVSIGSDSDVGLYQELGTAKIPPRPFLTGAAYRKEAEILKAIGDGVEAKIK